MVHGGRNFLAVPERAFQTDFISASLVNIKTGVGIVELGPRYENHIVWRICDLPLGAGVGVGVGVGIVMITEKKGKRKSKHGLLLRLSLHKKQVGISGKGRRLPGVRNSKRKTQITRKSNRDTLPFLKHLFFVSSICFLFSATLYNWRQNSRPRKYSLLPFCPPSMIAFLVSNWTLPIVRLTTGLEFTQMVNIWLRSSNVTAM